MGMRPSHGDIQFARTVYTKLLTNFAKTHNPTPEQSQAINTLWPVTPKTIDSYTTSTNNSLWTQTLTDQRISKYHSILIHSFVIIDVVIRYTVMTNNDPNNKML